MRVCGRTFNNCLIDSFASSSGRDRREPLRRARYPPANRGNDRIALLAQSRASCG